MYKYILNLIISTIVDKKAPKTLCNSQCTIHQNL